MPRFFSIVLLVLLLPLAVACQGGDEDPVAATAPIAPTVAVIQEEEPAPPTDTDTLPPATLAASAEPEETVTPVEAEEAIETVAPAATSAPAPLSEIRLAPVVSGLDQPTFLGHAFDERLFIVEKPGRIQIVQNGSVQAMPFLDITDRVGSGGSEQGLLSIAFHPDYAANGIFFVNYTDRNGDTVISRLQVSQDANRADADSERILLTIPQPYGNHNGGQLQFGPDGYLYVGMGDGGSAGDPQNNGQDPATLLGTLLRLDVDNGGESAYAIPPDNPYVGSDGGRNEVWAYGLRNPWRFSFDRVTADLFIADVGQNMYEEVNVVPAGQPAPVNYGWNIMEGLHCFRTEPCDQEGLYLPAVEYSHPEGGCSVTGGYVYRGQRFPTLTGNYFYGDFCSGMVWSYLPAEGESHLVTEVEGNITSFGEDVAGEIYLLTQQGQVYQIQP